MHLPVAEGPRLPQMFASWLDVRGLSTCVPNSEVPRSSSALGAPSGKAFIGQNSLFFKKMFIIYF